MTGRTDTAPSALIAAGAADLAELNPIEPGRVRPHRLYEDATMRVRAISFDTGEELTAHTSPVPILVAVTEGRVRFDAADETYELTAGGMVRVDADVVHSVRADEPARIIVVMMLTAD